MPYEHGKGFQLHFEGAGDTGQNSSPMIPFRDLYGFRGSLSDQRPVGTLLCICIFPWNGNLRTSFLFSHGVADLRLESRFFSCSQEEIGNPELGRERVQMLQSSGYNFLPGVFPAIQQKTLLKMERRAIILFLRCFRAWKESQSDFWVSSWRQETERKLNGASRFFPF